jgi:hypothetical protein
MRDDNPYVGVPFPDEEPPAGDDTAAAAVEGAPAGVDADGELSLPSPEELLLEHDGQLGRLREDVDGLAGLIADLLAEPPKSKPAPWNWKELEGPAAAELLTGLREWIDWYNTRYGVAAESRIPGCWYRHGPVVEELTAVWIAWRAAYYGHKTPSDAAAYWHERILWPTIARIKKGTWGLSACNPEHKDPRPSKERSTDSGFTDFLHTLEQQQNTTGQAADERESLAPR